MKLRRRQFLHLAAGAAALPAVSGIVRAQINPQLPERYPTRAVRVIVPAAPGGSIDVFARLVTHKLSEELGKQFHVENLPGASGNTGTAQAAKAAADGYTVLLTTNNLVISPSFFDKIPYDPFRDFEPVTLTSPSPVVLSINPSVPANTVTDLIRLIRAQANITLPREERARCNNSQPKCFDRGLHSTSLTFPSTAAVRQSPRRSRATHRSSSVSHHRSCRLSRMGHCVRSR
jgi:tripartite-type tricarboxylate transporter receptor subunit TctC